MNYYHLIVFLGISILSSASAKNSAIGMIEQLRTYLPCYPKGYVTPAKWVRRIFKIRQRMVPRYLYFELLLSLFYAILGPLNLLVCLFTNCNKKIVALLVIVHCSLIIVEAICDFIIPFILKQKKVSK